jgi:hypothetical protein
MNCEKARDRFSSLWEKDLAPSEERILKEHLSSCPECRREFEQFEKTMGWLHFVGEVDVPQGFLQGLAQRREEEKGAIPFEKSRGKWSQFPFSLKLPAQALTMVAIVFLVLYFTKMMPMAPSRPGPGLKAGPVSQGEGENRRSESTRGEPSPTVRQAPRPEQSLETGAGVGGWTPSPPPKVGIKAYQQMESKEQGRKRTPFPEPGEMENEIAVHGRSLVTSKPPQEIILKISDRKNVIPQLQDLVKQFGGEVVATEGDRLTASLPAGSFSKFEKELGRFRSSGKADGLIAKKRATGSLRIEEGPKKEEGDEEIKGSASSVADSKSRTTVRILLLEE